MSTRSPTLCVVGMPTAPPGDRPGSPPDLTMSDTTHVQTVGMHRRPGHLGLPVRSIRSARARGYAPSDPEGEFLWGAWCWRSVRCSCRRARSPRRTRPAPPLPRRGPAPRPGLSAPPRAPRSRCSASSSPTPPGRRPRTRRRQPRAVPRTTHSTGARTEEDREGDVRRGSAVHPSPAHLDEDVRLHSGMAEGHRTGLPTRLARPPLTGRPHIVSSDNNNHIKNKSD